MAIQPERWEKVKALFVEALELTPSAQAVFLRNNCPDEEVRLEVERLLTEHQKAGSFLSNPALRSILVESDTKNENFVRSAVRVDDSETAGSWIDRYQLLQKIGEGGMGEVWLAEQKEPVHRQVALKLVKAGMNTREVIARFHSERQALAMMLHPAIAKVLDAGSTPKGTPYFVMEYVAGVPVTSYCDEHRLTTRARLEIFTHVCEGVQHAHQKAIIHRDLKPSNILVTEIDGHPAPKIIDFGVAKALGQRLTEKTLYTSTGALVGTPQYMSPEQALSAGQDIDTRSDVYSLGIIFYELLAGVPPIELRKIAWGEFLRRLREEEPLKPSTKLRAQDPATTTEAARKRQTDSLALLREMRGDLDLIALKALEKDQSRRYASASDFAADIGRYLRNEPVVAAPPALSYLARKFARRHRAALATTGAFVLVLIAATGISMWESIRAMKQRDRADAEAASSHAISDFLRNDVLAQAGANAQAMPGTKPDPDLKVRTALDRAAARIGGKFAGRPEVEADIRQTMGLTYEELGLYPEARTQLEKALDLHRRAVGSSNRKTLETVGRLARVCELQGEYPEAEALLNQSMAIQKTRLGPDQHELLATMGNLANVYNDEGKYPQAEVLLTQIRAIGRRVLGPEEPLTLNSMINLGNVYFYEGKYSEAEGLYSQTLEIRLRKLGPDHPDTLSSMHNLALVEEHEGKYPQAETLLKQTVEIKRRVLGLDHPDTLKSMNNLANIYHEEGKLELARALCTQTLEIQRRVLGPEHPDTLWSENNLAGVFADKGKYQQAEALYSQTLNIQRRLLGPQHPDVLDTMDDLAQVYVDEGAYASGEALLNETLEIAKRVLGPEHPNTLGYLADLVAAYLRQRDYALAERYGLQTLAARRHALGPEDPNTMVSAADLALAYLSQGKFAESEPLAHEAMLADRKNQPDEWQRFRAASLLGESLAGEKKYTESEPLLLEGYQGMLARKNRIDAADQYHLDLAHQWVVQLYQALRKPEKAAEWEKK